MGRHHESFGGLGFWGLGSGIGFSGSGGLEFRGPGVTSGGLEFFGGLEFRGLGTKSGAQTHAPCHRQHQQILCGVRVSGSRFDEGLGNKVWGLRSRKSG